jgi:two-component system phosphate regulon sensor histidine kinase PhoR
MTLSLILLAGFLIFYLWKVYRIEKQDLQKEAGYLFENAFKTAENHILDEMIYEVKGISWLNRDSMEKVSPKGEIKMLRQSSKIFISDTIEHIQATNDGKAHVKRMGALVIQSDDAPIAGDSNLNVRIQIKSDSLKMETTFGEFRHAEISEVEKIFMENLKKSGLDIRFSISEDSLQQGQSANPEHEEMFSSTTFYLNVDGNNRYIFGKIFYEILLAAGLFLAVLFAFYSMMRSYNKKQEIYQLRDDFMRNMTHELKTPIATIGVALEAVQNFRPGEDEVLRQEYFRIAESENQKLNALVDKVLSVSQTMDSSAVKQEQIHLPTLLEEMVDSFQLRANQHGVSMFYEDLATEKYVRSDQQMLVMLVHNLVDNAIKYVRAENPEVRVSLYNSPGKIHIAVSDNGIPIPETYREKIFEKFYRVPSGDVHDVKGHGIGLYMVAQLALALKGKIALESVKAGNNFVFTLTQTNQL